MYYNRYMPYFTMYYICLIGCHPVCTEHGVHSSNSVHIITQCAVHHHQAVPMPPTVDNTWKTQVGLCLEFNPKPARYPVHSIHMDYDPFKPPFFRFFFSSPLAAVLFPLHQSLLKLRHSPFPRHRGRPIRVVCISDTHSLTTLEVPEGDLLIHAGDLCNYGTLKEIQAAVDWLRQLPHPHKVVICGNHDSYFDARSRLEEDRLSVDDADDNAFVALSSSSTSIRSFDDSLQSRVDWGDIHYLQHSSVTLDFPTTSSMHSRAAVRTLTLYGAPQIPAIVAFGSEHAFTYPPHHDAWTGTVPPETDILITHTPPAFHRDLSPVYSTGCPFLLSEVWRVRPILHVFGHVHAGYGREPIYWDNAQRAWERFCARRRSRASLGWLSAMGGFWRDLFDLAGLADAAKVVVYGVLGVIWARIWGGEDHGGSWMVNASCMYRDSGRLRNKPQVVEL